MLLSTTLALKDEMTKALVTWPNNAANLHYTPEMLSAVPHFNPRGMKTKQMVFFQEPIRLGYLDWSSENFTLSTFQCERETSYSYCSYSPQDVRTIEGCVSGYDNLTATFLQTAEMLRSPDTLFSEGLRLAKEYAPEETLSISASLSGSRDVYGRRWILQDNSFSTSPGVDTIAMQITGPIASGEPIGCKDVHPYSRSAYIEGIYGYYYEYARPEGQAAYISATVITYEEYTTLYKHVPKTNSGRQNIRLSYGIDDLRYAQYYNGAAARSSYTFGAGTYVNTFSDRLYNTSGTPLTDELREELYDYRLKGMRSWVSDDGFGMAFPIPSGTVDVKGYRTSEPYCPYTYFPALYDKPVIHNALSGHHFLTYDTPWWHDISTVTVSLGDSQGSWLGYRFYLDRNTYIDDDPPLHANK